MPADVATGRTLSSLMLQLAVRAGEAVQTSDTDTTAKLPDDAYVQQRLREAVNSGWLELVVPCIDPSQDSTIAGHEWSWLRTDVTITTDPTGQAANCVNGAADRYWLPRYVRDHARTDWVFEDQLDRRCANVHHEIVDRKSRLHEMTGWPELAGIRQVGTRYQVQFWPKPSAIYHLRAEFSATPVPLQDDDRHIAGQQFDGLVFAAAWLAWCRETNDERALAATQLYREQLVARVKADRRQGHAIRGMAWSQDRCTPAGERTRPLSTIRYNGTPV
ncbi:MAG: hypothetical protein SFZ23_08655 [Planctomycetota bacterium]|nr:hypothetical protein [Planctomycetota bacterium]